MLPSGCFPFKRRSWLPSDPATTTTTSTTTSTDTDPGSPLSRLFRSKSDTDVKKSSYKMKGSLSEMDVRRPSGRHRHNSTPPSSSSSSSHSPSPSSSSSSRRYRRVLRDVAPPSGDFSDDNNPNVVHKFSKEYLEKHNIDKASSSSSAAPVPFSADQFGSRKDLPYEVSGSTILKRPLSVSESGAASATRTATSRPTISFGNEVEVIEFDKKEKVKARSSCMRRVQLSMDDGDVRCGGVDDDDDDTEEGDDAEKENSNSRCRSGDTSSPRDERVLEQWE